MVHLFNTVATANVMQSLRNQRLHRPFRYGFTPLVREEWWFVRLHEDLPNLRLTNQVGFGPEPVERLTRKRGIFVMSHQARNGSRQVAQARRLTDHSTPRRS